MLPWRLIPSRATVTQFTRAALAFFDYEDPYHVKVGVPGIVITNDGLYSGETVGWRNGNAALYKTATSVFDSRTHLQPKPYD